VYGQACIVLLLSNDCGQSRQAVPRMTRGTSPQMVRRST